MPHALFSPLHGAAAPLRLRRLSSFALCALLGACASKKPQPAPPPEPAPVVIVTQAAPVDDVAPLLSYHQSLRRMSQGELLKELSGLMQQKRSPRLSVQMAMVLMLTRGGGDLARAQSLLDNVANSTAAESAPFKTLAQLLSNNCGEMRRLADVADKLAAQQKESQRRIEQLNDMVEGLKNIERTLPARPSASMAPAVVK